MAIVIVDDEDHIRLVLRKFLAKMGHKAVFEARDGEEALKIVDHPKRSIQMIISDWNMPNMDGLKLAEKISQRPALSFTPFLLITSETSKGPLRDSIAKYKIPDAHVMKPFDLARLSVAMSKAYAARCMLRNTVTFVGDSVPTGLAEAIRENKGGLFKMVCQVSTLKQLQDNLKTQYEKTGALIFQPTQKDKKVWDWLKDFRKNSHSAKMGVGCAGRNPKDVFPARECFNFFIENSATKEEWLLLIKKIELNLKCSWDMETLFRRTKAAILSGRINAAWGTTKEMLKMNPYCPGTLVVAADIQRSKGNTELAIEFYQKALGANPCQPRPYIQLLKIVPKSRPQTLEDLAHAAESYCPQSVDLLLGIAQTWISLKKTERAKETLRAVLKLQPKNAEAKKLISELPAGNHDEGN